MSDPKKHVIPMTIDQALVWVKLNLERGRFMAARSIFNDLVDSLRLPPDDQLPPDARPKEPAA